jgi:hypothetical protein
MDKPFINKPPIDSRRKLKNLISQCTDIQQLFFKKMYSHKNIELPIDQVIDNMGDDKIDWAISQCETTINNNLKTKTHAESTQ